MMAWTSSAAQGACAHTTSQPARRPRLITTPDRPDTLGPHGLTLAAVLHIVLLAATIPLGPEIAIAAVSLGSAVTLLFVYRDTTVLRNQQADDTRAPAAAVSVVDATPAQPIDTAVRLPLPAATTSASPADAVWSEIMGQISHELRTPLNAIIGFSDLMGYELHGPVGDPRYQEYLGHIRSSGRLLLKSAEDTLALTELLACRRGDTVIQVVDLERLLDTAVDRLRSTHSGSVATVVFDPTDARGIDIEGDCRALGQILLNVFNEARERAGDTGAVTIAVRNETATVAIDILTEANHVPAGTSLRLSLAGMMAQLNGGSLHTGPAGTSTTPLWRATLRMDMVRQPDLFRH